MLHSEQNPMKKSWHLIKLDDKEESRPRQVVFVEIYSTKSDSFIYLAEMELKKGASGQCTLLFHTNDFSKTDAPTLDNLLKATGINHRWPKETSKRLKDKDPKLLKLILERLSMTYITHPKTKQGEDNNPNSIEPSKWATQIQEEIQSFLPTWE